VCFVFYGVYRDDIDFQLTSKQGLAVADLHAINHVIDYYIDHSGYYYYLDYENGNTYMYKLSPTGEMLFKYKLPNFVDGKEQFHTKISVDNQGNIYTLVAVASYKERILEREWIRKYDPTGKSFEHIFEIVHTESKWMGNPFAALSNRLIQMQIIDDKLYVFDHQKKDEIHLISIPITNGHKTATNEKILQLNTSLLREIIVTSQEEIYILNRHANILRIDKDKEVHKVDIIADEFIRVIPHSLTSDTTGNVYFTDVYNGNIMKINFPASNTEPLYELATFIDADRTTTLGDLRNIRMFDNGQLAGHTTSGQDNNIFATYGGNQTGDIITEISIPWSSMWKEVLVVFLLSLLGILLVIGSIQLLRGRIGLVAKQIMIFIPVFFLVMLGMVVILATNAKDSAIQSEYEKLSVIVEQTAKLMDVEEFLAIDLPAHDRGEQYQEIVRQVNIGDNLIYYITYYVENDSIYAAVSNSVQSYTPIEYLYDAETVEIYYQTLRENKTQQGATMDSLGEWMLVLTPIRDDLGNVVGILEHGIDAGRIDESIKTTVRNLILLMLGITAAVSIAYLIMLRYSLRALSILRTSVAEVASGRWDTKVDIRTKDEFQDIGMAFNRMSDQIQDHIEDITLLNKAYVKFVPDEIFKLLGKKSILEVKLGEQVTEDMTIMYIKIRNIEEQTKQMDTRQNYEFINQVLEVIVKIVNEKSGVVERFEGAGAMALFQAKAEDALIAALRILEALTTYNIEQNQHIEAAIAITSGPVLVGIVGHDERMATTIISDELSNIQQIENMSTKLGVRMIITQSTLDMLDNKDEYSYRYIGRVKDEKNAKMIDLYEFLDGYPSNVKNSRRTLKAAFEEGIVYYQEGNFGEARKRFISVIRSDREDQLAKTYLFLCEKYNQEKPEDLEGTLEII